MRVRTQTPKLEQFFRLFLMSLTVLSAILIGIAYHLAQSSPDGMNGIAGTLTFIGVIAGLASEVLQKQARIPGFGCMLGVVWLVVIVLMFAL